MTADWRCPECGCHSYAHVQEQKADGSFGPGPKIRCVNCKAVWMHKSTLASPRADSDERTAGSKAVSARTLAGMLRSRIERAAEHKFETVSLGQFFADQIHRYLTEAGHGPEHDARVGDVPADDGDPDRDRGRNWGLRARQVYLEALSKRAAGGKWFASTNGADGLARLDNGTDGMFPVRGEWHEIEFVEALVNAYRNGDFDTPAQPAGVVPDSLREAFEAAELHECWVNGDTADVMTNPYGHCGNFDQIVARCATGDLWRKRAVAIAESLNFVRTLLASHPAGQSAEGHAGSTEPHTDWNVGDGVYGASDKIAPPRPFPVPNWVSLTGAALPAGQSAGSGAEIVKWGSANTVGELMAQLRTLPADAKIFGTFKGPEDKGDDYRTGVRGVLLSRERIRGRWIRTQDKEAPYEHVIWTVPEPAPDSTRTGQGEADLAERLRREIGEIRTMAADPENKAAFCELTVVADNLEALLAARPAAPEMGCLGPASAPSTKEG